MSGNIKVKCPNCKNENVIDIFLAREGSRIICKDCKKQIIIHFEGKIPQDIINGIKKEITKSFPKEMKIG